jgi:hypothetical protein
VKLRPAVAIVLPATAVILLGGALVVRHHRGHFRNSPEASATLEQINPRVSDSVAPGALRPASTSPLPAAASPEAAVRSLLDAMIAGDAQRSFGRLAAADRVTYGPVGVWEDHLSDLPHYLGYRITGASGTSVTTDVTIEPRLDEVVGYIPSRAHVTWTTVAEDGGYRVSFTSTLTDPILPTDAAATKAALAWVAARKSCRPGDTYAGNLIGQPTLADALCHVTSAYRAGAVEGLESFHNPTLLLNAFGAEAPAFVRVVPLKGASSIEVALAPLGDRWQVVGVMEA